MFFIPPRTISRRRHSRSRSSSRRDGMGSQSSMRAPSVYALEYIRGGSCIQGTGIGGAPDKIYQCLTVRAFLLTERGAKIYLRARAHVRTCVRACVRSRVCARTKLHASRIRAKRRRGRSRCRATPKLSLLKKRVDAITHGTISPEA